MSICRVILELSACASLNLMLVITDLMVFSLRPNCHVGNELLESVFISTFVWIYLKMAVFFFLDYDVDFQE